MEVTLTVLQLALLAWALCVVGSLIGWFLASMCTCGKIEDLETIIHAQQERIAELRTSLRQEIAR